MDVAITTRLRHAAGLLQQGQLQAAADAYRGLVQAHPHLADAWYNLGYLLRRLGDATAALDAYAQALQQGGGSPEQIHLNRAGILGDDLQQPAQAAQELRRALALRPGYAAALLNLGNLHEELGEREPALAAYRQLLAGHDASGALRLEAQARLLRLEPPADARDPRLAELARAAATPGLAPAAAANVQHALAHAYDRLHEYTRAFDAATAANRHRHAAAPRYDPERSARRTDALIAGFGPGPETPTADDAQPLFICGMFRSGSTLLEQVLSRHPQVRAGGELDALPQLVAQRLQPFPAAAAALSRVQLDALAERYRQHTRQVFGDAGAARYLSDKRPDNFLMIGLIKRLFPAARIVHTVRHPLDNGLSIFLQQLNPHRFDYAGRLEDIGHYYGEYRRLMAHWTACYPQSLHTFDYDAFVHAPEPILAALLRFLELPWEPDCLQFHRAPRAVRTGSYWQVRQPLHAGACGRWRHYREPLAPLRQALRQAGVACDD